MVKIEKMKKNETISFVSRSGTAEYYGLIGVAKC